MGNDYGASDLCNATVASNRHADFKFILNLFILGCNKKKNSTSPHYDSMKPIKRQKYNETATYHEASSFPLAENLQSQTWP